jgi:PPM family protein phosphatase
LGIQCGARTDQGKVRPSNEDSYIANIDSKIFAVADGMGGHAAGEIASRMTAEKVQEVLSQGKPDSGMESLLLRAVYDANATVHEAQKAQPAYRGMGSTLTLLTFSKNTYYIAQVGDSRAYLFRKNVLEQLTQDHSLIWPLYKNGIITKDELARNPRKNLITRSIGTQLQVEADLEHGPAFKGDLFLLCSDGLTDVLTDNDISRILSADRENPQDLSDRLIEAANSGGGPDNITAVIVHLTSDPA